MLNGYPPLILATLALAQSSGSLEVAALARPPGELASTSAGALHWLGALAWALALPPMLGIGAFAAAQPRGCPPRNQDQAQPRLPAALRASAARFFAADAIELGLRLRAVGLVLLAALPWSGGQDGAGALARALGAAVLIATLLWGYDRLASGRPARRWAWAYLGLDAALLLALLWAAYAALQDRLS
jgi:hypothetical protein